MGDIFDKLVEYCGEDYVPMHMPGHKRNTTEFMMGNPYGFDITEIDGFDNLHNPNGIIMDSMNRAADIYGAAYTFYLVNGSSAGLLAAISATTGKGGKIIVARNCHKSVYNGIYLNELRPVYVYPDNINSLGINSGISAESVNKLLKENKDVQAVIITSPTYEGVISDICEIAKVVHSYHIPLIVDEAHGAHFHFNKAFPESALDRGADIVVQSIHKTLPAFTQTAVMHVKSQLVDIDKLKRYWDMYQSTSPSYILLAGIDNCMQFLTTKGPDLFEQYVIRLKNLRNQISKLNNISLFESDDISKLVIYVNSGNLNGKQLYDILLEQYHIQLEMASAHYAIAMTSVMDKTEYYDRFIEALRKIDNFLGRNADIKYNRCLKSVEAVVIETPYSAMNADFEVVRLVKAQGRVCGSAVYVYPPGIPIVFSGELITQEIIDTINDAYALDLEVIGMETIQFDSDRKNSDSKDSDSKDRNNKDKDKDSKDKDSKDKNNKDSNNETEVAVKCLK